MSFFLRGSEAGMRWPGCLLIRRQVGGMPMDLAHAYEILGARKTYGGYDPAIMA